VSKWLLRKNQFVEWSTIGWPPVPAVGFALSSFASATCILKLVRLVQPPFVLWIEATQAAFAPDAGEKPFLVEMAWYWLRYQPASALAQWIAIVLMRVPGRTAARDATPSSPWRVW
jgi:hypothetical protein